jgi:UrcA family protein
MKTTRTLATLTGIVAVTLGGFAGSSVQATEGPEAITRAVVVRYYDLDLTSEAGRKALRARFVDAAERACGTYDGRNLPARRSWIDCVDAAVAAAADAFDAMQITGLQAANLD